MLGPAIARADEWVNPKASIPPKAAPQRQNAGEGVPPLPIPGTPLRRSEPKREPSPPALVGSVTFSPQSLRGGAIDWQTTVIDIEQWVQFTNANLGQRYRFVETDFSRFSYDPTELPILYFTGWKALPHFDRGTIERLRSFLMAGGTWWFTAIAAGRSSMILSVPRSSSFSPIASWPRSVWIIRFTRASIRSAR
jgi:hypothetical protein